MNDQRKKVVIDTLERVNSALQSDANAMVTTTDGECNPERAYVELVRKLVEIYHDNDY